MSYAHLCLNCGTRITAGQEEIQVGGYKNPVRYRHSDTGDCMANLNAIERSAQVWRRDAPRDDTGVVYPRPALDERERGDAS
jgi:hypothetical protein